MAKGAASLKLLQILQKISWSHPLFREYFTITSPKCSPIPYATRRYTNALYECLLVQHRTIDALLERGEKLDDLVERSNQLSMQSKAFYTTVPLASTSIYYISSLLFIFLIILLFRISLFRIFSPNHNGAPENIEVHT